MNSLLIYLVLVSVIALTGCAVTDVSQARVESCRGCRLNRLPDVKAFIFEDLEKYNNVEFKPIPGASPILILLDDNGEELERIDLAPLNRQQCNDVLIKHGFTKVRNDL